MAPEPKMITERDVVMRERAAFLKGFNQGLGFGVNSPTVEGQYPLPKVTRTRPRVVADPHGYGYWTVGRDMAVRLGNPGDDVFRDVIGHTPNPNCRGVQWLPIRQYVTAERAALWADLLASPLEEVEDDA